MYNSQLTPPKIQYAEHKNNKDENNICYVARMWKNVELDRNLNWRQTLK